MLFLQWVNWLSILASASQECLYYRFGLGYLPWLEFCHYVAEDYCGLKLLQRVVTSAKTLKKSNTLAETSVI